MKVTGTHLLFVAAVAGMALSAHGLELTSGGVDVVVAADAPSTTRFAASEMTNFLSRVLGASVPVVHEPSPGRVPVFVGDGPHVRAAGIDVAALPHDGFALRVSGTGVIVAGERVQRTLHLTRPVAQLRFIAPEALTFLSYTGGVGVEQMRATLRYTTPLADGYNVFRDAALAKREGATVEMKPVLDASGELIFCSDFVFAPAGADRTVGVEFSVTDLEGNPITSFSGELPIRRGWSTAVSFKIPDLGGGNKTGGIGLSPGFDEEIEVLI